MYNVLLVEDEKIEREMISKIIQTAFAQELCLLCTVDNGGEALQQFQKYDFDLIITDINMPIKDGLQLLQEVKAINPEVASIILTSYDYFSYAQRSIRLGVDDFILKPVSADDLCMRIRQVLQATRQSKMLQNEHHQEKYQEMLSIVESDCVYAIISDDPVNRIQHYFAILNYEVACGFCISFANEKNILSKIIALEDTLHQAGYYCIRSKYFEYMLLFVFYNSLLQELDLQNLQNYVSKANLHDCFIGIGDVKEDISEFYHSFKESLDRFALHNQDHIIQFHMQKTMTDRFIRMLYHQILHGIHYYQKHLANDVAERLYQFLLLQDDRVSVLQQFARELRKDDAFAEIIQQKETLLKTMYNTADLRAYVMFAVKNIIEPVIENRKKQTNRLILDSYYYIEKNYHRPIGLNDLAAALHVTPQYLSSVLSQQDDNNFTNMLSEFRIEKAKALLAKGYRIKDVSFEVGFQNQNYFAKIFKKNTGMTPKEYKNMLDALPI